MWTTEVVIACLVCAIFSMLPSQTSAELEPLLQSTVDIACGIRSHVAVIRGGRPARQNEFAWMVVVRGFNWDLEKWYRCAGFLITLQHVVTSALCRVQRVRDYQVHYGHTVFKEMKKIEVAYEFVFRGTPEVGGYHRARVLVDIAILELVRPIFDPSVRPICIADEITENLNGASADIIGWGVTDEKGTTSDILRVADTVIRNPTDRKCAPIIQNVSVEFCAYNMENSFCAYDAGSPLMVHRDGRYFAVGVASAPTEANIHAMCGKPDEPQIFTKISVMKELILEVTSSTHEREPIDYRR